MNEYASERKEAIPEERFNMQEVGSNDNMVPDNIYAKLKKMNKAIPTVSNSWG